MEKVNASEQKNNLISALTQGRELANELKKQLDPPTSSENCEALAEKIVSTYDRALAMLSWQQRILKQDSSSPTETHPDSINGFSKDQRQCHKDVVSKKRKIMPKGSEQVRVCSGTGLEGPLDDGHSWRKYGQKDILGANFPRAYYRCTHRNSRGCLATKLVQRSDEDPSVFEVTYKGKHSCIQEANTAPSIIIPEHGEEMHKPKKARSLEKAEEDNQREGVKMETEVSQTKDEIFRSFSFSFRGMDSEILESQFFCDHVMEDRCDIMMMGTNSPTFLSPTTSDSNYNFGIGYILQKTSESDVTDVISTPTSVITSSPFGDLDFAIDHVDFDPSFSIDDSLSYFS